MRAGRARRAAAAPDRPAGLAAPPRRGPGRGHAVPRRHRRQLPAAGAPAGAAGAGDLRHGGPAFPARIARRGEASGKAIAGAPCRATRRRELAPGRASDATLVVSPVERELLAEAAPGARVELLSNIHVLHGRRRGFHDRRDLVFLGGFGHPPNADALHWLADEILPALRRRAPSMQLHVLGDVPDTARRALDRPGLVFHGRVTDLAPVHGPLPVSVAPLRFGAGCQGQGQHGHEPRPAGGRHPHGRRGHASGRRPGRAHRRRCGGLRRRRAGDCHEDPGLWLRLSDGGLENVRRHFSPDAAAATLRRVLDGAAIDRGTEA